MRDIAYAFTICFATLGPLNTIPAFFLVAQSAAPQTRLLLAVKSVVVATAIVLFILFVASGALTAFRVSVDAVAIAGGIVLLISAVKTLSDFQLVEMPEAAPQAAAASVGNPFPVPAPLTAGWLGRPVLSPLAVPSIVPPIGVAVVLFFSGLALGDAAFQAKLVALLLFIMGLNFLAMLVAVPIMRVVGLPILQLIGWVFSALQAGLAVEAIVTALRNMQVLA
jgi:multiple antibiotic resistance protein